MHIQVLPRESEGYWSYASSLMGLVRASSLWWLDSEATVDKDADTLRRELEADTLVF